MPLTKDERIRRKLLATIQAPCVKNSSSPKPIFHIENAWMLEAVQMMFKAFAPAKLKLKTLEENIQYNSLERFERNVKRGAVPTYMDTPYKVLKPFLPIRVTGGVFNDMLHLHELQKKTRRYYRKSPTQLNYNEKDGERIPSSGVRNRLTPLRKKDYDAFAEAVWEQRGCPKFGKQTITKIRWGFPATQEPDGIWRKHLTRFVGVWIKGTKLAMGIEDETNQSKAKRKREGQIID